MAGVSLSLNDDGGNDGGDDGGDDGGGMVVKKNVHVILIFTRGENSSCGDRG